jgi:putative colanic acid biosynthesis UDP-glucose lipid carrier transferase
MPQGTAPVRFRTAGRLVVGRNLLLNLFEALLDPMVLVLSLWIVSVLILERLDPADVILSLVVFSLTYPGSTRLNVSPWRAIRDIVVGWLTIFGLLMAFGYASGYLRYFDSDALLTWFWVAPASQVGAHFFLRWVAPAVHGRAKRAVVAGMNEQGIALAQGLREDAYSNIQLVGFFDDRSHDRLDHRDEFPLLGKLGDLPGFVKKNRIDLIYLSLPMTTQQRILSILDGLRDTTASIYFVPDTFVTDLIQGRMGTVSGIPVVAVCETPFTGVNGVVKRASDIVLSLLILALISPLLLLIALAIKLSSPGPVIFRQRRYGLDGRDIVVYKFRTMSVMEDGDSIKQAEKGDPRITRLGAFLRAKSLDELPQFFNVIQGRMSIVGPRPHAVAHNELYRKSIKGYMLRHKVRPGITGWAQVNGYRGETESLDKMRGRVDHDLDYLRNWSLRLDLHIIAKTVLVMFRDERAW